MYTIGDLSRRSGLPVRTIRFYSDAGVLPPTARTGAGHRRYDDTAASRLDLLCTLRQIGFDLATIQRVLADELTVAQAAAVQADALDAQIRLLRLRRAVLRRAATTPTTASEMAIMDHHARLTATERRRLVDGFLDSTFGAVDANPELVELLRQSLPELPDEPAAEQLDSWIELAELVQDPGFLSSVRRMAAHQAAERAEGDRTGLHHDLTTTVRDRVTAAIAAGIRPESPEAAPVVADLIACYADTFSAADTSDFRARLVTRLEVANDFRVERYWGLVATINGWPAPPSLAAVFDWFIPAVRCRVTVSP
ncbi:MerR family transcriptional regulator [Paractinoplanes lichenicola]|uniref:MerR family transcriptional regulator n=1 Tax=Paractinoplanes lichenicola TaxID=2802976 RepID=A0ABS1W358_9ACTN|nr:MerR family transcriptional regulator [Actinoplanes lichenicola]MBL7261165.1 MerR family transcriptional regulator [Actinoplanes lichenicola]